MPTASKHRAPAPGGTTTRSAIKVVRQVSATRTPPCPSRSVESSTPSNEVCRETPEYERACFVHDSSIQAIIEMTKTTIRHLQKTPTVSKSKIAEAVLQLTHMISHMEELEIALEIKTPAHPAHNATASEERLDRMEEDMKEIKAMLTNNTRTWAEIAGTTTTANTNTVHAPANPTRNQQQQELRKELRKEKRQMELDLSTARANEEVKQELAKLHPGDIVERCRRAIDQTKMGGQKPTLLGINKLSNGLRLHFKSASDAQKAREVNWPLAAPGLEIHEPWHGLVAHGVLKADLNIDDQETAIKELEEANQSLNLKVEQVRLLRPNKQGPAAHHSIVVFTKQAEVANQGIRKNIIINHQCFHVERYAPQTQIMQCFNCYEYGHRARECKNHRRCGRCAKEGHDTNQCEEMEPHCSQCQGKHVAWDFECPARKTVSQRRLKEKRQGSPFFKEPDQ